MKTFVDTSALYALLVAEDMNHQQAVSVFEQLQLTEAELVSTNYIVLECASLVQRRHGFESAKLVLQKAAELLDIVWIGPEEHRDMMTIWMKASSRTLSLVDCASFTVMRARNIRAAAAFDAHFVQAGFDVLPRADRVAEPRARYRAGRAKRD